MDKTQDTTRSFTPEEVADIVTETVQETEKDLHYLKKVIGMIARLTVDVCLALEDDPDTTIEPTQSRDLRRDALRWKVVTKLKEGA